MDHWYALYCHSNTEHIVEAKLETAGVGSFYPHLVVKSKDKRGRDRERDRKFFPGYLFARFDLAEKTPVIAIPQVVSILGWGNHAVAIPDSEVEAVRFMVSAPDIDPETLQPVPYMSVGDRVMVQRGPLAGLEGFVVFERNATRVVISVTMLCRSISAEVDIDSLKLLKAA